MKPLLWGFVLLTVIQLGIWFTHPNDDASQGNTASQTSENVEDQGVSPFDSLREKMGFGEDGSFSEFLDLTDTTPGQALAREIGPEWVNWIIWPLVIVILFSIIHYFRSSRASVANKGKEKSSGGSLVVGLILLAGILVYFFGDFTRNDGGRIARAEQLPDVAVDLRRISIGETVTIQMGTHSNAKVQVGSPPIADGVTSYWICAKVVEPAKLLEHPSAPDAYLEYFNRKVGYFHDMQLTEEMQDFLAEAGIVSVATTFTLVATRLGVPGDCSVL